MFSLIDSGPAVFSPMIAGALLPVIGLTGILTLDVVTFILAIGSLLVVHVPQPEITQDGQDGAGSLLEEAAYGFKYIFARKCLFALLVVILFLNLVQGFSGSLFTPMLLLRTANNSAVLGSVQSAFAIGGVVGGLVVSTWGGFKKDRIRGMLIGWGLYGILGLIIFGSGRSLFVWIPVAVLSAMIFPLTQSASNAIWQSKVAPDVQGRVFSARRLIAWVSDPVMPVIAGVMADYVTEPAMASQTGLSRAFGWWVGTGPGSGKSLQYIFSGLAYLVFVIVAWNLPVVRNVEKQPPDQAPPQKSPEPEIKLERGSSLDPQPVEQ